MTDTRELAATLAADVVGYSRLAGSDEGKSGRFCFSGVPQHSGPFTPGLTVSDIRISRAENHDAESPARRQRRGRCGGSDARYYTRVTAFLRDLVSSEPLLICSHFS